MASQRESIEQALQAALPPTQRDAATEMARIITALVEGRLSAEEATAQLQSDPAILSAIPRLHGKHVQAGKQEMVFVKDSQSGDVTVRDVAGGSIFNITLNPPPAPPTAVPAGREEQGRARRRTRVVTLIAAALLIGCSGAVSWWLARAARPVAAVPPGTTIIPFSNRQVAADGVCQPAEYADALSMDLSSGRGTVKVQHDDEYIHVCLEATITAEGLSDREFGVAVANAGLETCTAETPGFNEAGSPCKGINAFADPLRSQVRLNRSSAFYAKQGDSDVAEFSIYKPAIGIPGDVRCDQAGIFNPNMVFNVSRQRAYKEHEFEDLGGDPDPYAWKSPEAWVAFALACP